MNKLVQIIKVPCNGYLTRVRLEVEVVGTPTDYLHCALVANTDGHPILQVSSNNFNSSTAHYAIFYFDYPVSQNQLIGIAVYRDTENDENYFQLPVFERSIYPQPLYLDIDEDGEITTITLSGCLRLEVEFENRLSETREITNYVKSVNISTGKGLTGDMLMGTATLTLRNANREFDVENTDSPFYGVFKLLSKVYILVSLDTEPPSWQRVFTGRIGKIQPHFASPYTVNITLNDTFQELQRRLFTYSGGSLWLDVGDVVASVLRQAGMKEDEYLIHQYSTHYVQNVNYDATPALDVLRDIVATEAHIHYIDGYGRYVFITSPVGWTRRMWYPRVYLTDDDYTSIAFDYDLTRVKNRIVVKYGDDESETVIVTNPESSKRYGVAELKLEPKLFPHDVQIAYRLANYYNTVLEDERGRVILYFEDGNAFFQKQISIAQIIRIDNDTLGVHANYMVCNISYYFTGQGKCSVTVEAEAIPQYNPQIFWQVDTGTTTEVEAYYFGVAQTFIPRDDDGNLISGELLGITMSATNTASFARDMKLELWQNNQTTSLPETKIAESNAVSFEPSESKTAIFYFLSRPILSRSKRYSIVAPLHWLPAPDYPSWSPTIRYFTYPNAGDVYINFSASASKLAQPFIANTSPNNVLSAVQVRLRHYSSLNASLERLTNIVATINTTWENVPTDTVVATSSNWNYLDYDDDGVLLNFAFTPPVTLTGGQVYALVLHNIMVTDDDWAIDGVPAGEPLSLWLSDLSSTTPTKIAFNLDDINQRVAIKQVRVGGTMPFITPLPSDLRVAVYDDDDGVPNQRLATSEPYANGCFEFRDANLKYLAPTHRYWLVLESDELSSSDLILLTSSSARSCYFYDDTNGWQLVSSTYAPQGLTVTGLLAYNAVEAWGRTDTTDYRAYYYDDDLQSWQYKTATTGISGKLYYSTYSPPYDVYWKLPISASLDYADGKALSLNPDSGEWEGYDGSDAYDLGAVLWGWIFNA